ncbi:glycosyltransferase [Streptomyces sp. NPDC004135]
MNAERHRNGRTPATLAPGHVPYRPVRVVDMELTTPGEFHAPGGQERIRPRGKVLALVRAHGHPVGMVTADATDPHTLWQVLARTAEREYGTQTAGRPGDDAGHRRTGPSENPRGAPGLPDVSVIVATHNRPDLLRQCLDSLLAMDYPPSRYEVIVVDNAPSDDATERMLLTGRDGRVRYVREPVAGLARAHNRGLAAARGRIAAFTDDDTLVDRRWLTTLTDAFSHDRRIGCVTGLIVPAELETEAQAALERHGGFGKGFRPRTWSLQAPPSDPLFPFTAGHFGSGANMAFRTEVLSALGGFDPATGTGTPAFGGDDLLAFFRVIATGGVLSYQPDAIVWHRHRRTEEALRAQAFGYGAGFGAYLTGALAHEPRMLPALVRRMPGGIRYAAARARDRTGDPAVGRSRQLVLLEVRGLLYGPMGYLRSRRLSVRHDGRPAGRRARNRN